MASFSFSNLNSKSWVLFYGSFLFPFWNMSILLWAIDFMALLVHTYTSAPYWICSKLHYVTMQREIPHPEPFFISCLMVRAVWTYLDVHNDLEHNVADKGRWNHGIFGICWTNNGTILSKPRRDLMHSKKQVWPHIWCQDVRIWIWTQHPRKYLFYQFDLQIMNSEMNYNKY